MTDRGSDISSKRLQRILDFLGIRSQVFNSSTALIEASLTGTLRDLPFAILAPLDGLEDRLLDQTPATVHSVFTYVGADTVASGDMLRRLSGCATAAIAPTNSEPIEARVSNSLPEFTGPMNGLQTQARSHTGDHVLVVEKNDAISNIVDSSSGSFFIRIQSDGVQVFVNGSSEVPALDEPLTSRSYDVNDHFFSAVPLLMFLKWAFRESCWQANEAAACLIVDDPLLRLKYGFCDFRKLDSQMREHGFTLNIAFIPWNWRRTSSEMTKLIIRSEGRYSICVHGSDHTRGEFAIRDFPILHRKTASAIRRMERHHERTGIPHDRIMIFPQGAFSRESLQVLQQYQFIAAVNTEVLPKNAAGDTLTVRDVWSAAILHYGSLPLFSRRYPAEGVANFAFDLLLGKPCLIVEHHQFFEENGRKVLKLVDALNFLNCPLRWRPLGEVIRGSYHWRLDSQGDVQIKMFANELRLRNQSEHEQVYHVERPESGGVPIEEVRANGRRIQWQVLDNVITFNCRIASRSETLIQIRYCSSKVPSPAPASLGDKVKIAGRRYASEFRDNYLSQHELLAFMAKKAQAALRRSGR